MSYTKEELQAMASAPRPPTGTPEYQRWRRARVACGLPTKLDEKAERERKYNTEYQRRYRKLRKACITCAVMERCAIRKALNCYATNWHCCLWKKRGKIQVDI